MAETPRDIGLTIAGWLIVFSAVVMAVIVMGLVYFGVTND